MKKVKYLKYPSNPMFITRAPMRTAFEYPVFLFRYRSMKRAEIKSIIIIKSIQKTNLGSPQA